jgi:mannonate dehydratase
VDTITLPEVAQIRTSGIVTALHEIPCGEVWTVGDIHAHQALIGERPDLALT